MKQVNPIVLALMILFGTTTVNAQGTWQKVYGVLHTNCNTSSCHGAGNANHSFNVDATASVLYDDIVNSDPVNPYAKNTLHHKVIFPSAPEKSFMMRKLSHCVSGSLSLHQPNEGDRMPRSGSDPLPDSTLELIFTWIQAGAPDTGTVAVDTFAGDICDWAVGIRDLPAMDISFSTYPNPASDILTCSYTLEQPALVTMELLDVSGKNVKTLFSENQNTGKQVKTIAPDVAPGIYFIRLTAGSSVQYTRKVAMH